MRRLLPLRDFSHDASVLRRCCLSKGFLQINWCREMEWSRSLLFRKRHHRHSLHWPLIAWALKLSCKNLRSACPGVKYLESAWKSTNYQAKRQDVCSLCKNVARIQRIQVFWTADYSVSTATSILRLIFDSNRRPRNVGVLFHEDVCKLGKLMRLVVFEVHCKSDMSKLNVCRCLCSSKCTEVDGIYGFRTKRSL